MIGLLVFTDGRFEALSHTLASFDRHVIGSIGPRVLFNDEPDAGFRRDLDLAFGGRYEIHHAPERRGFAGTIAYAWSHRPDAEFLFHLEDDFLFFRPIDLDDLGFVMNTQPALAQMALRRQPIHPAEVAAGGLVEAWPGEYLDRHIDLVYDLSPMVAAPVAAPDHVLLRRHDWLEHRLFFTTNPSLYRQSLCELGWPTVDRSEEAFTQRLFRDESVRCGYWGQRDSGTWVEHFGIRRGSGY